MVQGHGAAYLCNITSLRSVSGLSVGRQLNWHCFAEARRRDHGLVFGQADKARIERRYQRAGFVTGFEVVGWISPVVDRIVGSPAPQEAPPRRTSELPPAVTVAEPVQVRPSSERTSSE